MCSYVKKIPYLLCVISFQFVDLQVVKDEERCLCSFILIRCSVNQGTGTICFLCLGFRHQPDQNPLSCRTEMAVIVSQISFVVTSCNWAYKLILCPSHSCSCSSVGGPASWMQMKICIEVPVHFLLKYLVIQVGVIKIKAASQLFRTECSQHL